MRKSKEFWTKANRKTIVCETQVAELADGDFMRPKIEQLTEADDPKIRKAVLEDAPIWAVRVIIQEGMDEASSFWILHTSRQEADAAADSYRTGDEIESESYLFSSSSNFDAEKLSLYTRASTYGRGEPPYGILFEALQGAGVLNRANHLSDEVLSWIGDEGQRKLTEEFGDNWEAVAALEYCVVHFHVTSLATLAARVEVADFVAETDYDAGYAAREFEMLYSGAEQLAFQAKSTRQLAGVEGGNASRQRRLTNLEVLMQEIENLSGAVGLISEDRIVSQAFDAAIERNSKMPKSKKTLEDYETALRSEEAFKARYDAVFRKSS